jgi:hypothetical protein
MPRGPKGERRPADVIGNAVHVRMAPGQIEDQIPTPGIGGKDPAAVALGRARRRHVRQAAQGNC